MSKERPILFNGAMVRAILAGQKTQTRRAIKNVPSWDHFGKDIMDWGLSGIHQEGYGEHDQLEGTDQWYLDVQTDVDDHSRDVIRCPFGQPGDRLWVRETWTPGQIIEGRCSGNSFVRFPDGGQKYKDGAYYRPDNYAPGEFNSDRYKWRPSIHMPRWACRLVLDITDVRVERLQAISEVDSIAEGIERHTDEGVTYYGPYGAGDARPDYAFRDLWISTGGDWAGNPWVWVIEFKVVTP